MKAILGLTDNLPMPKQWRVFRMNWFRNLKIFSKLILGFSLILSLTLSLGILSLIKLANVNAAAQEVGANWLPSVRYTSDINTRLASLRRIEFKRLAASAGAEKAEADQRFQHFLELLQNDQAAYELLPMSDMEKREYPQFKNSLTGFLAEHAKLLKLDNNGKSAEAKSQLNVECLQQFEKASNSIERILSSDEESGRRAAADAASIAAAARAWEIGMLLVVILTGVLLAIWIARLISNPLRQAADRIMHAAENRDLTVRLTTDSRDEVGQIAHAFNSFIQELHNVVTKVAHSVEQVATASEEISSAATQASEGTRTQSEQTTQVATAMQEISSTVIQVSDNSRQASNSAQRAADVARQGGVIVGDALDAMRGIAESVRATGARIEGLGNNSDKIGKIIGVIDDIADQTNLLALNAAIEAARAGEQGRGFAVVADEVRKLAERTTKATKEIAQMIETVQSDTRTAVEDMKGGTRQVEVGVETTSKAGDSLQEIITAAQKVDDMVAQIATASIQQSTATEQINSNIEQIAKISQESAAGAQQSARACQDLSNLALDMQQVVAQFRLAHDDSTAPATRSARRRKSGERWGSAASPMAAGKVGGYEQDASSVQ
jgi:methyl-accepting chemotaxis protein